MDLCKEYNTYFGQESEQIERTSKLLIEIARTRFDKCRLTDAITEAYKQYNNGSQGKNKKKKK